MIYIAFDPGERWTGFAIMEEGVQGSWKVDTGVINDQTFEYRAARFLDKLLDDWNLYSNHKISVICEDYFVRPVGHQNFTRALTARLIGSLEYVTRKHENTVWFTEQPIDPRGQLELLNISRLLESWKTSWSSGRNRNWNHARSAWRVLSSHLLKHNPDVLIKLKLVRTGRTSPYALMLDANDYYAPTARWI